MLIGTPAATFGVANRIQTQVGIPGTVPESPGGANSGYASGNRTQLFVDAYRLIPGVAIDEVRVVLVAELAEIINSAGPKPGGFLVGTSMSEGLSRPSQSGRRRPIRRQAGAKRCGGRHRFGMIFVNTSVRTRVRCRPSQSFSESISVSSRWSSWEARTKTDARVHQSTIPSIEPTLPRYTDILLGCRLSRKRMWRRSFSVKSRLMPDVIHAVLCVRNSPIIST